MLIYDAQGKRVRAMTLPEGTEITPQPGGAMSPSGGGGGGGNKHLAESSRDEKDAEDDDSDEEMKGGGEGKEAGPGGGRQLGKGRVVFVDWYDGAEGLLHPQVPTLCIALDGGFVQLSRGVDDDVNPLVVNAHMTIRQASKKQTPSWFRFFPCAHSVKSMMRYTVCRSGTALAFRSTAFSLVCRWR